MVGHRLRGVLTQKMGRIGLLPELTSFSRVEKDSQMNKNGLAATNILFSGYNFYRFGHKDL